MWQLFREYAEAFRGRHQFRWSRGLKARFAIEERTDEELAVEIEEGADLLGRIELPDWRRVLHAELRGELLELARAGGWPAVEELLRGLRPRR